MRTTRFAPPTLFLLIAVAACSPEQVTQNSELAPVTSSVQGMSQCTPGADHAAQGKGQKPDSLLTLRCNAKAGDLLDVQLEEFLPTQGALGFDEVHYKLGRYRSNKDQLAGGFNKRFEDWCESNGQEKAASVSAGARLDNPASFSCAIPLGSETAASIAPMKTAVIGPHGKVYLTDGHHTFTSFRETADGGPKLHVRVRIQGNLSNLSTAQFWREMASRGWVWLFDENDNPIKVNDLPPQLGLGNFRNDPYRGMIYFTRDIGYEQLPEIATFQEFFWGRWFRQQTNPALTLSSYNLNDLTSYLALVRAASEAMVALPNGFVVSDGRTALQLGKLALWNAGAAANKGEFAKLSKPFTDAKPGKIAYALEYRGN